MEFTNKIKQLIIPKTRYINRKISFDSYFELIHKITLNELCKPYYNSEDKVSKQLRKVVLWYPSAMLAIGLSEHVNLKNDTNVIRALQSYYDLNICESGQFKPAPIGYMEQVMHGYSLLKLFLLNRNEKYLNSFNLMLNCLKTLHRNSEGIISYRDSLPGMSLVDSVGMICPFLALYGLSFNDSSAIDMSINHILDIINNCWEDSMSLPFHGHIEERKLGIAGWCRGTGWFLMGMVNSMETLVVSGKYDNSITKMKIALKSCSDSLLKYQTENGGWRWAIANPFVREESSGSAMIGFALQKALNNNFISGKQYQEMLDKLLDFLVSVTEVNGKVNSASGDCEFGPGTYPSAFGHYMYAQGATFAFLCQYKKSKNNRCL